MGDTSVELWLDRHRFSALEQEMEVQGTSLEKHLQNYLIDLYTEQVLNSKPRSHFVKRDAMFETDN